MTLTKHTLQSAAVAPQESPVIPWGDFKLNPEDITRFRTAIQADFPGGGPWSDDEIRQMAYDSLHLLSLLRTIAAEQTTLKNVPRLDSPAP